MRYLNQNTGAVTTLVVGTFCSTVRHVDIHLKTAADNIVGLFAFNVGNKAHATRVMLICRIIKTLRSRKSSLCHCLKLLSLVPFFWGGPPYGLCLLAASLPLKKWVFVDNFLANRFISFATKYFLSRLFAFGTVQK